MRQLADLLFASASAGDSRLGLTREGELHVARVAVVHGAVGPVDQRAGNDPVAEYEIAPDPSADVLRERDLRRLEAFFRQREHAVIGAALQLHDDRRRTVIDDAPSVTAIEQRVRAAGTRADRHPLIAAVGDGGAG